MKGVATVLFECENYFCRVLYHRCFQYIARVPPEYEHTLFTDFLLCLTAYITKFSELNFMMVVFKLNEITTIRTRG